MKSKIIEELKAGNIQHLGDIYRAYRDEFYTWGKRQVKQASDEDLKDAFSDTLIIFLRKVKEGKVHKIDKKYLFTIGRYLLLNKLRSDYKREEIREDFRDPDGNLDPWESERVLLRQAIDKLGPRSKQLMQLYYFEQKSIQEIKDIMGFESLQAVSNRKTKSKSALLKHIAQADSRKRNIS